MAPTTFGSELLVNTTTPDRQTDSHVAALAGGGFVVVWSDDSRSGGDTSGSAIRAQVFSAAGTALGAEFLVNTTTQRGQFLPAVTALEDGSFFIAWTDNSRTGTDTSSAAVRAQHFLANGTPDGPEFVVNTTTPLNQFNPAITHTASGGVLIAWADESETGNDTQQDAIRAQIIAADGTPVGNEILVNTTTPSAQVEPALTTLANGSFVISWTDNSRTGGDTSGSSIRAQIIGSDGTPTGPELLLNTATTGNQFRPSLSALQSGGFVAVWIDSSLSGPDTDSTAISGQVFDASGMPLGVEFTVNTTTAAAQQDPVVTLLNDGRFIVTWEDFSATGDDTSFSAVRARLFEPDGTPSGDDFVVNTTTAAGQFDPSIAALADGRIIITWTDQSSTGGDTSETAIRAQIFDPRDAAISLAGGALDDDFAGTQFDDHIAGNTGNDSLSGEAGNDTLDGGSGSDMLAGGAGIDTATYISATGRMALDLQNDNFDFGDAIGDTFTSIEIFQASRFGDQLRGDAGDNIFFGGNASDRLYGRAGDDILNGEIGADALYGNIGADIMTGGAGDVRDRFIYFNIVESGTGVANRDIITDFQTGIDRIEIRRFDADTTLGGKQAFAFIGDTGFSNTAGELRFEQDVANGWTLVQADTNGDGIADFEIELTGLLGLNTADFLI